jgi:septal ring factor EnvC (AmiA/AmiB activator)
MADLDNMIEFLSSSHPDIVDSIDRLKKRRAELMKELNQVDQDLKAEEQKFADLPSTIAAMQEQRESGARQAQVLREQVQMVNHRFYLLDKFLLEELLYPNDASKLVVVAGNVEGEISGQPPLLEYRVGSHKII